MPKTSRLALVEAAQEYFDSNIVPPEHDAHPLDAQMYQYSVARDAALFFDKERKRLLESLTDNCEARIDEAVDDVRESGAGIDGLVLLSGDIYNLYLKISAPPRTFDKSRLPNAIRAVFPDATPAQVKEITARCTVDGTPRKTFEALPKQRIDS